MSKSDDFSESKPQPRVLFVCVENSNRSQMAEAFARMYGAGRVEAFSAGSRPSGRVHPKAVEAMQELGYGLTQYRSKGLADISNMEFDVAVEMGCDDACSCIKARAWEDWKTPCPKAMPPERFRAVRDEIAEKVKELLAGLQAHHFLPRSRKSFRATALFRSSSLAA